MNAIDWYRIGNSYALGQMQDHLLQVKPFTDFKIIRDKRGHMVYFLGNGFIHGRNRGACSKNREGRLNAHFAVWFKTDDLADQGHKIIERLALAQSSAPDGTVF